MRRFGPHWAHNSLLRATMTPSISRLSSKFIDWCDIADYRICVDPGEAKHDILRISPAPPPVQWWGQTRRCQLGQGVLFGPRGSTKGYATEPTLRLDTN
jgi:hypothetical protein